MKKLKIFNNIKKKYLPMSDISVHAGFPSPAEGYEEERIDINDIIITNPPSTFYVRVKGNSMINANIHDGDILVIDKSLEAKHDDIVIAVVDGCFTVKTLFKQDNILKLTPANDDFPDILFSEGQELQIWGVVCYIIYKVR